MSQLTANSDIIERETTDVTYAIFTVLSKLDHLLYKANGYKTVFSGQASGHSGSKCFHAVSLAELGDGCKQTECCDCMWFSSMSILTYKKW
jgi:hypothetical protein